VQLICIVGRWTLLTRPLLHQSLRLWATPQFVCWTHNLCLWYFDSVMRDNLLLTAADTRQIASIQCTFSVLIIMPVLFYSLRFIWCHCDCLLCQSYATVLLHYLPRSVDVTHTHICRTSHFDFWILKSCFQWTKSYWILQLKQWSWCLSSKSMVHIGESRVSCLAMLCPTCYTTWTTFWLHQTQCDDKAYIRLQKMWLTEDMLRWQYIQSDPEKMHNV